MAKVRNLSDIQQEIAFTEFDFYQRYEESFKTSELGRDLYKRQVQRGFGQGGSSACLFI